MNVFYGHNGAGKTSVLEAVFFLSHLRSFKVGARSNLRLINTSSEESIITSKIVSESKTHRLGLRNRKGVCSARIDAQDVNKASDIASLLPVVAIHPGSFELLTGARKFRRAFLDWGVFYREPRFSMLWNTFNRSLKQRNAAIKSRLPRSQIKQWDDSLARSGAEIAQFRKEYLDDLTDALPSVLDKFALERSVSLIYQQGWPGNLSLQEYLDSSLEQDLARGFTFGGPQRAGFRVLFDDLPLSDVGSRGQIKMITSVLKLVQVFEFEQRSSRGCILLLDDIDAELDDKNFEVLKEVMANNQRQTFISTLHPSRFTTTPSPNQAMFHVEQGQIEQVL